MLEFLAVLAVLAAVAWFVSAPLRDRTDDQGPAPDSRREDLEAARDSRLADIREAELDRRTGKLSDADWKRTDAGLRADLAEVLRELDEPRARR